MTWINTKIGIERFQIMDRLDHILLASTRKIDTTHRTLEEDIACEHVVSDSQDRRTNRVAWQRFREHFEGANLLFAFLQRQWFSAARNLLIKIFRSVQI